MNNNTSYYELLQLHLETSFVLDSNGNLCTINEPWDKSTPSCKLFLGYTKNGDLIRRLRHDVTDDVNKNVYSVSLLYCVPSFQEKRRECVMIDKGNVTNLTSNGFSWLVDEVAAAQPCVGVVVSGQIVSVCRSVRISPKAHEAGIETLENFRGRGYAMDVLAAWAEAVRALGAIPLYSTDSENHQSQRVAEKSSLLQYGVGIQFN